MLPKQKARLPGGSGAGRSCGDQSAVEVERRQGQHHHLRLRHRQPSKHQSNQLLSTMESSWKLSEAGAEMESKSESELRLQLDGAASQPLAAINKQLWRRICYLIGKLRCHSADNVPSSARSGLAWSKPGSQTNVNGSSR